MLIAILQTLTGIVNIDSCCADSFDSVLYWLLQDLPNQIVSERLCDPPGKKLFDAELTGRPSAVPLSIALLIGALGRLACAVAPQTKTDELVFESNLNVGFRPLLLQKDRNI
jgi:hypothetical protein